MYMYIHIYIWISFDLDRQTVFFIHEDCFELNVSRSTKHVIRMTVYFFDLSMQNMIFFYEKRRNKEHQNKPIKKFTYWYRNIFKTKVRKKKLNIDIIFWFFVCRFFLLTVFCKTAPRNMSKIIIATQLIFSSPVKYHHPSKVPSKRWVWISFYWGRF